jgi:hypothetical protein
MLTRISSILGALALGGLLVASAYGAPATEPHAPADHARLSSQVTSAQNDRFVAPVPHKYRADGLRMGLHCETASMAMP